MTPLRETSDLLVHRTGEVTQAVTGNARLQASAHTHTHTLKKIRVTSKVSIPQGVVGFCGTTRTWLVFPLQETSVARQ